MKQACTVPIERPDTSFPLLVEVDDAVAISETWDYRIGDFWGPWSNVGPATALLSKIRPASFLSVLGSTVTVFRKTGRAMHRYVHATQRQPESCGACLRPLFGLTGHLRQQAKAQVAGDWNPVWRLSPREHSGHIASAPCTVAWIRPYTWNTPTYHIESRKWQRAPCETPNPYMQLYEYIYIYIHTRWSPPHPFWIPILGDGNSKPRKWKCCCLCEREGWSVKFKAPLTQQAPLPSSM